MFVVLSYVAVIDFSWSGHNFIVLLLKTLYFRYQVSIITCQMLELAVLSVIKLNRTRRHFLWKLNANFSQLSYVRVDDGSIMFFAAFRPPDRAYDSLLYCPECAHHRIFLTLYMCALCGCKSIVTVHVYLTYVEEFDPIPDNNVFCNKFRFQFPFSDWKTATICSVIAAVFSVASIFICRYITCILS